MFVNRHTHIVSETIEKTALINLAAAGLCGAARMIINRHGSASPDMLNQLTWNIQTAASLLQVILTGMVFFRAYRTLARCRKLIPREDYYEMAKLQEEVLPDRISALSSYSMLQLLEIWAGILLGVKIVYDIFTGVYREFVADLSSVFDLTDASAMEAFRTLYNNTHAFKYIGMLIAIALGVFITGIFLNDRKLKLTAAMLAVIYILSATGMQMGTCTVWNRDVAIVWSSVVFQLLQTVGLLDFSLYLKKRYRGV